MRRCELFLALGVTLFLGSGHNSLADTTFASEAVPFNTAWRPSGNHCPGSASTGIDTNFTLMIQLGTLVRFDDHFLSIADNEFARPNDTSSVNALPALVGVHFGGLAKSSRTARITDGILGIGIGGCLAALGLDIAADHGKMGIKESDGYYLGGLGVGLGGHGIWRLCVRTRAEREWKKVRDLQDPVKQYFAGRQALYSLATRGEKLRIATGIIFGFASFGQFLAGSRFWGCIYALIAVWEVSFQSREERTLHRFLNDEGRLKISPSLSIGAPAKGRLALAVHF